MIDYFEEHTTILVLAAGAVGGFEIVIDGTWWRMVSGGGWMRLLVGVIIERMELVFHLDSLLVLTC